MNNKKFVIENNIRANQWIKNQQIRLVGDNVTPGIYSKDEAQKIAYDLELDLVEVSQQNGTSVCKVVDFSKYLYDLKRKDKDQKRRQKEMEIQVKEIQLGSNIDEHDFNFKLNHAKEFLSEGDSVLAIVKFKGREITYTHFGIDILKRFAEELEGIGVPENVPKLEGKKMFIRFRSKVKKK